MSFNKYFFASVCLWISTACLLHYRVFNLGICTALFAAVCSLIAFMEVRKLNKIALEKRVVEIIMLSGLPPGRGMPSQQELQKLADEGCDNPNCQLHGPGGVLEQLGVKPQRVPDKKWPTSVN